mgnify:CR=1 FL=1
MAAGGVVFRRENGLMRLLLIRDRFGRMTLPKGRQEPGETLEQTALREIEEETGISGRIAGFLETVRYGYVRADGMPVDKEAHYFLVEAVAGSLRAREGEIAGAAWHPPDEAWRLQREQGYPNNDAVLRKALEVLGAEGAARGGEGGETSGGKPASGVGGFFPVVTGVASSVGFVAAGTSDSAAGDCAPDARRLASMIDHTLLRPEATADDIRRLCDEAKEYGFCAVCVQPRWVALCRELLEGSGVKVATVCGFPHGASLSEVKVFEASCAADDGADEIDMVISIGSLRQGRDDEVEADIRRVVEATAGRAIVKAILETALLTDEEKRRACRAAERAGAAFVKTSTGFGPGGATARDVRLLRASVSPHVGVKASGGIRTAEAALAMIEAGATRIGTSSGVAIVRQLLERSG